MMIHKSHTGSTRLSLFYNGNAKIGILANSENPDKTPYRAKFDLGMVCLLE